MSPFTYLLWLALLFLTIMLLVGCASVRFQTPTPALTAYPPVTLTAVDIQEPTPFYTPTPPARVLATPPSLLLLTSPPPIPIDLEPPVCYETAVGEGVCLGRMYNDGVMALTDIAITVRIGTETKTVHTEQVSVAPQTFAPYRATFARLPAPAQASASLHHARWHAPASPSLSLEEAQGKYVSQNGYGLYVFSALVANRSSQAVAGARLIVTLVDAEERVVSYRVLVLRDTFPPQSSRVVQLALVPLVVVPSVRHVVTLEELSDAG